MLDPELLERLAAEPERNAPEVNAALAAEGTATVLLALVRSSAVGAEALRTIAERVRADARALVLSFREAHYLCEALAATRRLCSMDVVEVNPALGGGARGADGFTQAGAAPTRTAAGFALSALGKTTLAPLAAQVAGAGAGAARRGRRRGGPREGDGQDKD
jgi:hypothetical protein